MSAPLALVVAAFVNAASVHLEASIDGGKSKPGWVYVKGEQKVTLSVVVRGAEVVSTKWFKIEPTVGSLDNTQPSFHFEKVSYEETELTACRDQLTCAGDVTPTKLPSIAALPGLGTMAFKVIVTTREGKVLSTPGLESTKYGGLTADVFRVTRRRDDSLIGYATELLNSPYIFGSAGPDGRNQSDLLIGADCADLVIYARRRMGRKAAYTSTYAIDQQAPELKKGVAAKVGDVLHFPNSRHVAILFEDREPKGVVTEDDLILHTCWAPPTVQAIKDVPDCASVPYRVLRFPN